VVSLKTLFEPIQISSLTLPNRIIMPALTTFYDFEGGSRYEDFYVERVRGGVGLIILGAFQSLYPGRAGKSGWIPDESVKEKGPAKLNHDFYIDRLRKWTDAIHKQRGLVAAQVATYGYWAKDGLGTPAEEISPSGVRLEGEAFRPGLENLTFIRGGRPLTVEEIHTICAQVGDAALRAKKAGFDAIELQALGGNLLSRFLSPVTNRRTDAYGGPLENRARMLLEAIADIKKKLGDTFPLICRINGEDFIPGGMTLKDYQQLAPLLERAGVHALDLMPGWYETRRPMNQMCLPRGAFIYLAEGLKQVVKIPVAANIRINDPVLAERALAEGKTDLIAMCSPLIADPELPNKAKEGRVEDIRMCTGCCTCWSDLAEKFQPIGCSVNAQVGKETQLVITPAKEPKKVWVIGGGPGGMEAARVAALRGHRVTLFEKQDRLGGQLLYADLPPHKGEWTHFIRYLSTQIKKLGVEVRLHTEITVKDVESAKPDAVVVATGAAPLIPAIPGAKGKNVANAIDVLTGKKSVGPSAVVIGGGSLGCETAEFLAEKGMKVTVLEMLPRMGNDIDLWNRWVILDRISATTIQMEPNTKAVALTEKGVEAMTEDKPRFFDCDTVVLAVGSREDNALAQALEGKVASLHKVGDCVKPQKVKQAVQSGFQAGLEL
jgi:2,4-dienoyl-CoA reductase (NADPH2)